MRPLPHRQNVVVWSQSASSVGRYGARPLTHTRRICRWIRTLALLTVVGLMPLARAGRSRWGMLLPGGVLTVAGVMLRAVAGGVILFPGLLFLLSALLIPASPKTDGKRRSELERELYVFSTPAQRRLASQAMALQDKRFPGF